MPRKRQAGRAPQADLVPSGAPYGQRQQNEALAAQIARPVPAAAPAAPAVAAPAGQPDVMAAADAAPFQSVGLAGPTDRPGEPLTAGMDMGRGPGSEILNNPASNLSMANDEVGQTLRDLYAQFPYPGIRELIEDHDNA